MRRAGLMLLLALGVMATSAEAVTIRLIGLGPGRAEIVVDGLAVRSLRPGQKSPEGVELLETARDGAVFRVDGARLRLALGESNRPAVSLRADERGQFLARIVINGRATVALVDTGASAVALSATEARRLGIAYLDRPRVPVRTAGGTVAGYPVTLASVALGGIVLSDVEAVVSELADSPPVSLLGMSFLGRVDWLRSGDTLILRPRDH